MVCDGRNILNGRGEGREERVYLKGTRFSLEICSSGGVVVVEVKQVRMKEPCWTVLESGTDAVRASEEVSEVKRVGEKGVLLGGMTAWVGDGLLCLHQLELVGL